MHSMSVISIVSTCPSDNYNCETNMFASRALIFLVGSMYNIKYMARNHGHSLFYSRTNLHITLKYGLWIVQRDVANRKICENGRSLVAKQSLLKNLV